MSMIRKKGIAKQTSTGIQYYLEGKLDAGTGLVFLNGMYLGKQSWIKQARFPCFRDNYKMVFFDYRGFGKSAAIQQDCAYVKQVVADIRCLVQEEGLREPVFVCYSIGGVFALHYAAAYPAETKALLLLNSGLCLSHAMEIIITHSLGLFERDIDFETIYPFLYPWNYSEAYLEKVSRQLGYRKSEDLPYIRDKGAIREMLQVAASLKEAYALIEAITTPALLVGSSGDRVFPFERQYEIFKQNKCFSFHRDDAPGHALLIEQYAVVNEVLRDFLQRYGP